MPCVVPAVLPLAMATQKQPNPAAPLLPVANHPLLVCTEEQASLGLEITAQGEKQRALQVCLGMKIKAFAFGTMQCHVWGLGGNYKE